VFNGKLKELSLENIDSYISIRSTSIEMTMYSSKNPHTSVPLLTGSENN
jgi:hypothetical protein